jgi:hypothetical protein
VVAAADAARFGQAEFQGGAAVRAAPLHQAETAAGLPEQHQVLAEDTDQLGRAAELRCHGDRLPIAPQIFAHGRARADPRELLVALADPGLVVAVKCLVSRSRVTAVRFHQSGSSNARADLFLSWSKRHGRPTAIDKFYGPVLEFLKAVFSR